MNKPTNGPSYGSTQNQVHYSSTSGNNNWNATNGPAKATSYNVNVSSSSSLPQIPQQQQQLQPQHQQQHQQQYQQKSQIKPPTQNQSQIPQAQGTMATPVARPPPPPPPHQQQTHVTTSRPPSRYGRVGVVGGNGQSVVETTIHRQNPYGNSQASSTSVPNAQSSSISPNPQQQQQQQQQNQYRPPLSLQTNTNHFSGAGSAQVAGTGQDKPGINNNNLASKRPAPSNNAVNNPYQSNSKIGRHSM